MFHHAGLTSVAPSCIVRSDDECFDHTA